MPKHTIKHRKQKTTRNGQKNYKHNMKGCSRRMMGGDVANLAYPSTNVPRIQNPFFAYSGKGGKSGSCGLELDKLFSPPSNTNGGNPTYPSTGPPPKGTASFFPNSQVRRGGKCGCSSLNFKGGANTTPLGVPAGFSGKAWTGNPFSWPNQHNGNHFKLNTYNDDVSRQMQDVGAAFPFLGGSSRTRRNGTRRNGTRRNGTKRKMHKRQKGGITLSNTIGQDVINLGRQMGNGVLNNYNSLQGYKHHVSPLPWKDQFTR